MVVVRDIDFASLCEHHMLPFLGKAHVAYIPDGKVIGLSKISAGGGDVRPPAPAPGTDDPADCGVPDGYPPPLRGGRGGGGLHMCMAIRGVKKANARMITSAVRGSFKENINTRNEFFAHIGHTHLES